MHKDDVLSIGQMAQRSGLAISAIRYYDSMGLIRPNRADSGQRRFKRSDIRRLSFIRIAQQFGFTLPQIKAELDRLPNGRTPSASDWQRISLAFRAQLDAQIDRMTKLRDNLDGCIGCGCLSLDRCAMFNPDDKAAQNGDGPRYLLGDTPDDI